MTAEHTWEYGTMICVHCGLTYQDAQGNLCKAYQPDSFTDQREDVWEALQHVAKGQ